MKYKRIWKDEDRFVISSDVFLYEIVVHQRDLPRKKLQPTFENNYWEVYALHRENALYYVIIGKNRDGRKFFRNAIRFSRVGLFFLPIGCDLAVKTMGADYWSILSYRKRNLINITDEFQVPGFPRLQITAVSYDSTVVTMTLKSCYGRQLETRAYWEQCMGDYYRRLDERKVKEVLFYAKEFPKSFRKNL